MEGKAVLNWLFQKILNEIEMKNLIKILGLVFSLSILIISSCSDDIDPVNTELNTERAFAPVNLTARIRNQTTIELDWTVRETVQQYTVEFYEDSLEFNEAIRTVTVLPDSLPLREKFFGDTRYSIRVKSISSDPDVAESTYAETTIRTEAENIFLPFEPYDVLWDEITVRFPENSEVTRLVINPGGVERSISAAEATAGAVTISELTGLTDYSITLYNNNSPRGLNEVTTLVDPSSPNVTLLNPGDDIVGAVAAAAAGSTVLLNPGDYASGLGTITVNKEITIRGQYPYDRPVIYNGLELVSGALNTQLIDLEMDGSLDEVSTVIDLDEDGVMYGPVSIVGCDIHDYGRQLIYGNAEATLESFSVDNSVITNFVAGGGDFIDFRSSHVGQISLTNSTFNNTPADRSFIRMDAASAYSETGLTSTVVIDHCTIYSCVSGSNRLLYVRFLDNDLTVSNTLIAETESFFTRDGDTSPIAMINNNYFNAPGFHTPGYRSESGFQFDQSGLTENPGFANPETGDFTVSNQTLKDNQVGDPRWLE